MSSTQLLLITYDLKHPASDYVILFNHLKSTGVWWHNIQSTWMIVTDKAVDDWANLIRCCIHPDDRFLVVDVTDRYINGWLTKDGWDWIRNCRNQINKKDQSKELSQSKEC